MTEIRNNTIKMKKRILAIEAAPAAIPPKPNTAATIAMIRKVTVQRNITINFNEEIGFMQPEKTNGPDPHIEKSVPT